MRLWKRVLLRTVIAFHVLSFFGAAAATVWGYAGGMFPAGCPRAAMEDLIGLLMLDFALSGLLYWAGLALSEDRPAGKDDVSLREALRRTWWVYFPTGLFVLHIFAFEFFLWRFVCPGESDLRRLIGVASLLLTLNWYAAAALLFLRRERNHSDSEHFANRTEVL